MVDVFPGFQTVENRVSGVNEPLLGFQTVESRVSGVS